MEVPGSDHATKWTTTTAFQNAQFLFKIYPDVQNYVGNQAISMDQLQRPDVFSDVTIYADPKSLSFNITQRLSHSCIKYGLRDITKTDAEKRFNVLSFVQMGHIALQNSFIAEGQRRESGLQPNAVPVLGRVLSIAAACGIDEIAVSEIGKYFSSR